MIEKIKQAYEKEILKQKYYLKYPKSKESKRAGRMGGLLLFIFGAAAAYGNYLGFLTTQSVTVLGMALAVAPILLGIWLMITGEMPIKR